MVKWMYVVVTALALGPGCVPLPAIPLTTAPVPVAVVPEAPLSARDGYIADFCDRYPLDRDCADWRANRTRWSEARYRSWLRDRRLDGDRQTAALFGFRERTVETRPSATTGADHVAACSAAYRSYDIATDSYVGFDGVRRRCRL